MIYDLVKWNDPILREEMPEFDFANPGVDITELSTNLIETMYHYNGVGLSANQCGLRHRVFVMRAELPFVCFNPRIVFSDEEEIVMEEGCLSFPGIVAEIKRPKHVRVRFATPSGVITTKTFTGLSARCFQHELMHLDGKVFFEGIGRYRMEQALKAAAKQNFHYIGLMKDAVS